jgi:hypothetical protein
MLRRVSCSHNRIIRHPFFFRAVAVFRSRCLFIVILRVQNSTLVVGNRPCVGHPCQKQPSTKMASLDFGKAKSGVPGSGRWRRQPLMPAARSAAAIASSVLRFRRERTAAITLERVALSIVSAIIPFGASLLHHLHFLRRIFSQDLNGANLGACVPRLHSCSVR